MTAQAFYHYHYHDRDPTTGKRLCPVSYYNSPSRRKHDLRFSAEGALALIPEQEVGLVERAQNRPKSLAGSSVKSKERSGQDMGVDEKKHTLVMRGGEDTTMQTPPQKATGKCKRSMRGTLAALDSLLDFLTELQGTGAQKRGHVSCENDEGSAAGKHQAEKLDHSTNTTEVDPLRSPDGLPADDQLPNPNPTATNPTPLTLTLTPPPTPTSPTISPTESRRPRAVLRKSRPMPKSPKSPRFFKPTKSKSKSERRYSFPSLFPYSYARNNSLDLSDIEDIEDQLPRQHTTIHPDTIPTLPQIPLLPSLSPPPALTLSLSPKLQQAQLQTPQSNINTSGADQSWGATNNFQPLSPCPSPSRLHRRSISQERRNSVASLSSRSPSPSASQLFLPSFAFGFHSRGAHTSHSHHHFANATNPELCLPAFCSAHVHAHGASSQQSREWMTDREREDDGAVKDEEKARARLRRRERERDMEMEKQMVLEREQLEWRREKLRVVMGDEGPRPRVKDESGGSRREAEVRRRKERDWRRRHSLGV